MWTRLKIEFQSCDDHLNIIRTDFAAEPYFKATELQYIVNFLDDDDVH